ncbi:MAG TPA: peptidylprolyl isomerase [Thermoanaerobaculia bacterium]|nr:peptidylprolyl isomerase [Thermoanaerobaculia bacterium]
MNTLRAKPLILLLSFPLLFANGCGEREQVPPDVIAVIGLRQITLEDFKRYLERNAGAEMAQITPEALSALLDQYTEEILLSEYAVRHGVEVPTERVAEAVRNDPGSTMVEKKDQMRREELTARLSAELPEITEEQILGYYRTHPAEFSTDERVRVRQILVHDQETARKALVELNGGAAFEDVSRRISAAPNASRGGDIGFVGRGELPQVFEHVIFDLEPGEISPVVETESSWHIFKVEQRRAAEVLDLERARPLIQAALKSEDLSRRLTSSVAEARQELGVRILTRRFPFDYSGTFPASDDE